MNSMLIVKNLSLSFGHKTILRGIHLQLEEGEIGCLLGPSGSGKTTLLRSVAGLEIPDDGEIAIKEKVVFGRKTFVRPEYRDVGLVFQDFALFPHLTVEQNLEMGLAGGRVFDKANKVDSLEKRRRVERFLELARLQDVRHSYPHEISGGQQQRVAMMRALIRFPRLLLMDEPFSSLDVHLRSQLAGEMRALLKELQITALIVTHDQLDAMSMADKVGVLKDGSLLQWSSAHDLYHRPQHPFVAGFVGDGTMIAGRILSTGRLESTLGVHTCHTPASYPPGTEVKILIRPDDILHDDQSPYLARIKQLQFRGSHILYTLELENGEEILSLVPSHHELHGRGERIGIRLEIDHIIFYPLR